MEGQRLKLLPIYARLYHFRPADFDRLTLLEFEAFEKDRRELEAHYGG